MFVGKYVRFTKQELTEFVLILIRAIEYTSTDQYVRRLGEVLFSIVVRHADIDFRTYNHIINILNKLPTFENLRFNEKSSHGKYYRLAYSSDPEKAAQGRSRLIVEIDKTVKHNIENIWSSRTGFMLDKLRGVGMNPYDIRELSSYLREIGCNVNGLSDNTNQFSELKLISSRNP